MNRKRTVAIVQKLCEHFSSMNSVEQRPHAGSIGREMVGGSQWFGQRTMAEFFKLCPLTKFFHANQVKYYSIE